MDKSHAETYSAITGEKMSPLDKTSAIAVAKSTFDAEVIVTAASRVDSWSADYSGPIPAWRISIASLTDTEVFVSMNTGEVTARGSMFSPITDFLVVGPGSGGKTSTMLGIFRENPETRAEFMTLLQRNYRRV